MLTATTFRPWPPGPSWSKVAAPLGACASDDLMQGVWRPVPLTSVQATLKWWPSPQDHPPPSPTPCDLRKLGRCTFTAGPPCSLPTCCPQLLTGGPPGPTLLQPVFWEAELGQALPQWAGSTFPLLPKGTGPTRAPGPACLAGASGDHRLP